MKKFKGIKEENKILIMLAFYSVGLGIWKNFRQLWLQSNNMDVNKISSLLSVGTFICVIAMILFTKHITLNKVKKTITLFLGIKIINYLFLFILNGSGNIILINTLTILDIVAEKIITTSIYPLITTIKKDGTIYSKRKLVEYLFSDIGILIAGTFIGRTIFSLNINYNTLLLLVFLFEIVAFLILRNVKQKPQEEKDESNGRIFITLMKDEIFRTYLIYTLISNIAMATGLGLKILMLTNLLNFSDYRSKFIYINSRTFSRFYRNYSIKIPYT